MPRQLWKLQAFPELPRHLRKCLISAIPCDIYTGYYGPQISRKKAQITLILRKSLTPLQKNTKRYALNKIFLQMQVLNCDTILWHSQCVCDEGFTLTATRDACVDRDECATNPFICGNGTCLNTFGSFRSRFHRLSYNPLKRNFVWKKNLKVCWFAAAIKSRIVGLIQTKFLS